MSLRFLESMQGETRDAWGSRHPLDVELQAESSDWSHLIRTGLLQLRGSLYAPPCTPQPVACRGTLKISPMRARRLIYTFHFDDKHGAACRLDGIKHLQAARPLHSMSQCAVRLWRREEQIAAGHITFAWRDLPEFLGSFWPATTMAPAAMWRPWPGTDPLEHLHPRARRTLRALVDALFEAGRCVPAGDDRTARGTLEVLAATTRPTWDAFALGLRWLDAESLLRHGRRFAALARPVRQRLFCDLTTARWRPPIARLGANLLLFFPKVAHFDRAEYLDAIGHPRVEPIRRSPEAPRAVTQHITSIDELADAETTVEAEIAIVGTGAGGAPLAAELALRGVAVVVVEEGRLVGRDVLAQSPVERVRRLWRNGGISFAVGTPVLIPMGRAVGGTTTINSGTCFATPSRVLDEWRHERAFPSDFEAAQFHRHTRAVEAMLRVQPATPQTWGRIGELIGQGASHLGLEHGPLPRNAPDCTAAGACIFGCPEGAKLSTDLSYMPRALRAGAQLFTGMQVTNILMRQGRVVALEAHGIDAAGARKRLRLRANRFVLACGSLLTPVLLQQHGFRHPLLGRNLSVHPATGLVARFGAPLEPWHAIPQGYRIDALADDGVQFEGFYLPPQFIGLLMPWTGAQLTDWLDDFAHLGQFGFMVRDAGDGWVRRAPNGRPLVGYAISRRSRARLQRAAALLCEVFLAAGASEVFTGLGRTGSIRTTAEARALTALRLGMTDFHLLGAHPLGTCQMGATPERGVVDFEHRVYGTQNLHIVDGSVVPTSLGVNPQVTIMAFALRAAEILAAIATA